MVKRKRDSVTSTNRKPATAHRNEGAGAAKKRALEQVSEPESEDGIGSESDDLDDESGSDFGKGEENEDEDAEQEPEEEEEEEAEQKHKFQNKNVSAQELQAAREAPELFKSSLFKLKIDEVMKNVKISDKSVKKMEKILYKINSIIENIPGTKPLNLDEAEKAIHKTNPKIAIPFSDPKPAKDVKYSFQYLPPKVNVVGSFSLKTYIRQPDGNGIDMVVVMPKALLEAKDFLNYRYLHKRSFYIAYLVSQLQAQAAKQDLPFVFNYKYFNDDPLKPIIRVTSAPGKSEYHFASSKFAIQILVALPPNAFEYKKLDADRNAIRVQKAPNADESFVIPATPLYNHAILTDATYLPYNEFLHRTAADCAAFKDACLLGRLWLFQRGFSSAAAAGGFGHFEWAMTMAVLLNGTRSDTHTLMKGYSSYQLFKGLLHLFATVDLVENEILFSVTEGQHSKFQKHHSQGPTITDRDFRLNVLANMTKSNYDMLRHEAAVTCDMLSDNTKDRFDVIFLKKTFVPELRYDTYYTVELPIPSEDVSYTPLDKIRYPSYKRFFTEKLFNILSRGYTDRVVATHLVCKETPCWGLERRRMHEVKHGDTVTVGLILDEQECEKGQTFAVGPQHAGLDSKTINARFDKFWGAKSEMRKFAGGEVKFLVSWDRNPHKLVVTSITEYLLGEYFSAETAASLTVCNQRLLEMLHVPDLPGCSKLPVNGKELFSLKHDEFLALANILMSAESGVNMRIVRVSPISASLRDASIACPAPYDLDSDDSVGWGLIEFETSQKWPETLFALEQTKTAFLLKISEKLADFGEYRSVVGSERGVIMATDKVRFLQVETPKGFIFRFRIKTEVDEFLYEEWDKRTKTTAYLAKYRQLYSGAQAHTLRIQALSRRFPFYSAAVRLLKTWFNRHLLTSHVREELIELLALQPFVDSSPYVPPSSPVSAFFRSLEFLASWNWKEEPLILDVFPATSEQRDTATKLSGVEGVRMDPARYQQLRNTFQRVRQSDPGLVHCPLFVGTRDDETGVLWSQQVPASQTGLVAGSRMTALARAAYGVVTRPRSGADARVSQLLFEPSLSDFDVVLRVHDDRTSAKKGTYRNLRLATSFPTGSALAARLSRPVDLFFDDIVAKYESSMIFFRGALDGALAHGVVAGVWKQGVVAPTAFKVGLGYSTLPVVTGKKQAMVVVNKKAVVEEIRQLGGKLIEQSL